MEHLLNVLRQEGLHREVVDAENGPHEGSKVEANELPALLE